MKKVLLKEIKDDSHFKNSSLEDYVHQFVNNYCEKPDNSTNISYASSDDTQAWISVKDNTKVPSSTY